MTEGISRKEFERFEADLKETLNLKFEFMNNNIEKIDKKMDSIFSYQKDILKDVARINNKSDKANERLDKVEKDVDGIKCIIHGDSDRPGISDKIHSLEEYVNTKKKYWQRFVYAVISLIVMTVGGYFLSHIIVNLTRH